MIFPKPSVLALALAAALPLSALGVQATRFATNPLITTQTSPSLGDDVNGPSLIKVPDWIQNPKGKYYLYFAHHRGQYIRLAYADSLKGPWKIYEGGVMKLTQLKGTAFSGHIASPDVHVDAANHRILLYFHGMAMGSQKTGIAVSQDGLQFEPLPGVALPPQPDVLGDFYLRAFRYGGYTYAFAKNGDVGAELLRSQTGLIPFEKGIKLLPKARHTAVLVRGDKLYVFYSRAGDAPERIVMSTLSLSGDWKSWQASEAEEIIRPVEDYEGAKLPLKPSEWGGSVGDPVNELRDPGIFEENGKVYLLYSIAGEQGIAAAELTGIEPAATGVLSGSSQIMKSVPLFPGSHIGVTADGRRVPSIWKGSILFPR